MWLQKCPFLVDVRYKMMKKKKHLFDLEGEQWEVQSNRND